MTDFQIVKLTLSHIPKLVLIEQQSHLSPWSEKVLASSFNTHSHNFALQQDGEIVGYYFTQFIAGELSLENICITQHQQGKGLGRKLMCHLTEYAHSLQAEYIWLEVRESNQAAIKLYKAFDFDLMGERKDYYAIPLSNQKETALLMKKIINNEA